MKRIIFTILFLLIYNQSFADVTAVSFQQNGISINSDTTNMYKMTISNPANNQTADSLWIINYIGAKTIDYKITATSDAFDVDFIKLVLLQGSNEFHGPNSGFYNSKDYMFVTGLDLSKGESLVGYLYDFASTFNINDSFKICYSGTCVDIPAQIQTTTTTTISNTGTTTQPTTIPTTTTIQSSGCPADYPVDCGNGYCCPSSNPVCGTGENVGKCGTDGGGCPADYPIDCKNGYCCPSDYPVCGTGANEGKCGTGSIQPTTSTTTSAANISVCVVTNLAPESILCGWKPPTSVRMFDAKKDYAAYLYLVVGAINPADTDYVIFYYEGKIYSQSKPRKMETSGYGYDCFAWPLRIAGTNVECMTGNWSAEYYINDQLQCREDFYIQGISPCIPKCAAEAALDGDEESLSLLRAFKDNVLLKTEAGKKYVDLYYQYSPTIVTLMEQNPDLKQQVRTSIMAIMPTIKQRLRGMPRDK